MTSHRRDSSVATNFKRQQPSMITFLCNPRFCCTYTSRAYCKSYASKNWILTLIVMSFLYCGAGTFADISTELQVQDSGSEFTSSADLCRPLPISVFQTVINIRQVPPYRDVTNATHPYPALHAAMTFQLHI